MRDKHPGEYRKRQAFIGAGLDIHSARFVPPPEQVVPKVMDDLELFLQSKRTYPTLVLIALAHYQFETIYPFADGNGRVGRLLIMLMLIQYELLLEPLLYLVEGRNGCPRIRTEAGVHACSMYMARWMRYRSYR